MFEITTLGVTKGDSYCDYTTRFLFRVYGMPMSSLVSIVVFGIVLASGFVMATSIVMYIRWRVLRLERLLEMTLKQQGVTPEMALGLNPEMMMGNEMVGEPIWFEYEFPVDDGYYDPAGDQYYKWKREHPQEAAELEARAREEAAAVELANRMAAEELAKEEARIAQKHSEEERAALELRMQQVEVTEPSKKQLGSQSSLREEASLVADANMQVSPIGSATSLDNVQEEPEMEVEVASVAEKEDDDRQSVERPVSVSQEDTEAPTSPIAESTERLETEDSSLSSNSPTIMKKPTSLIPDFGPRATVSGTNILLDRHTTEDLKRVAASTVEISYREMPKVTADQPMPTPLEDIDPHGTGSGSDSKNGSQSNHTSGANVYTSVDSAGSSQRRVSMAVMSEELQKGNIAGLLHQRNKSLATNTPSYKGGLVLPTEIAVRSTNTSKVRLEGLAESTSDEEGDGDAFKPLNRRESGANSQVTSGLTLPSSLGSPAPLYTPPVLTALDPETAKASLYDGATTSPITPRRRRASVVAEDIKPLNMTPGGSRYTSDPSAGLNAAVRRESIKVSIPTAQLVQEDGNLQDFVDSKKQVYSQLNTVPEKPIGDQTGMTDEQRFALMAQRRQSLTKGGPTEVSSGQVTFNLDRPTGSKPADAGSAGGMTNEQRFAYMAQRRKSLGLALPPGEIPLPIPSNENETEEQRLARYMTQRRASVSMRAAPAPAGSPPVDAQAAAALKIKKELDQLLRVNDKKGKRDPLYNSRPSSASDDDDEE